MRPALYIHNANVVFRNGYILFISLKFYINYTFITCNNWSLENFTCSESSKQSQGNFSFSYLDNLKFHKEFI